MSTHPSRIKSTLIFGGAAIWGLFLVSCVMTSRTMVAPPSIPGATFVGSSKCTQCHEEVSHNFAGATHAKLIAPGGKDQEMGCESCHGAGSLHVKTGGAFGTIVNPNQSPETCFACHLDKRAEFSLPNAHPVMSGKVTCGDCHDSHSGSAIKGSASAIEAQNESCVKCHTQQKGPYIYEHGAMREGCVSCHNPHGTVNQKMLVARDYNLCLQCHLQTPTAPGQINANAIGASAANHTTRAMQGTCWAAGCHEAPHGSNANYHLRF